MFLFPGKCACPLFFLKKSLTWKVKDDCSSSASLPSFAALYLSAFKSLKFVCIVSLQLKENIMKLVTTGVNFFLPFHVLTLRSPIDGVARIFIHQYSGISARVYFTRSGSIGATPSTEEERGTICNCFALTLHYPLCHSSRACPLVW